MDDSDEETNVADLLRRLRHLSETPAKQRAVKASVSINQLCDYAFRKGLDSASLQAILNIVSVKSELDQTSVMNLVKNLYPKERIPSAVVTKAVSALGQGKNKPSTATQSALLKWLFTVYDVLDDTLILSRLYAILFNLLDMVSLRYELCRIVGNEPAVLRLLSVYKDYYPDIIISSANPGRGSLPPQPDATWTKRLQAISHQPSQSDVGLNSRNGFKVYRTRTRTPRLHLLPESSVTLEEIEGPQDFVDKIERIELPNQLVSSLQDSLLQKLLFLNPLPEATMRLEFWLASYLEEELSLARNHLSPSPQFPELLQGILAYSQAQHSLISIVEVFLAQYLPIWDGQSNYDALCAIIAFVDRHPHDKLHSTYFAWLERPHILNTGRLLSKLLLLYSKIAQRWILQQDTSTQARTGKSKSPKEVSELLDYANLFIHNIISMQPTSTMIHSAILTFYESFSFSATQSDNTSSVHTPIVLPSEQVVNHLLFNSSLSDVSRLCGILARCKRQFESLKNTISDYYPSPYTNRFNGHLMDICNLIWRSRALNGTDTNASGCLCPPATMSALMRYLPDMDNIYNLAGSFGITQNYLFCAVSMATFTELEDAAEIDGADLKTRHAGPVSPRSLTLLEKNGGLVISWTKSRVEVLSALEAKGLDGVKDLMFSTMMKLKDAT
ncbi:Mis6-domain-containing protein [Pseudovirgaria hyperparasitica]|uniref:Mis6-domain-containing protein n=1 Tax=Pseudovirgaria hyperparasitica TaxID=470096 RepID=A0A6A6VZ92_9PEZI|nr:Mis6-domain-containing protein [Pseudovirgaria hyperparasitica]KAF2755166.1 Mis6-domain-containing protein [Pseudovirgaria hyperparasitica]